MDDATLILIREYQILEYLRVFSVTLFLYDYLATLNQEIATIWTGKWTTLKVLYLLVRYIPFLSFTDLFMTFSPDYEQSKFCMAFFQFNMWTSTIGLVMAEACFFLRAYALWGTSRGVAIFLVGLFTTMIVVGFTVEGIVSASASMIQPIIDAPRLIPPCIVYFEGATLAICGWLIVMVVDTILITMIIYARSRMYRCPNSTRNHLLNHVFCDAIYYFFCNFFISVTAVVFYFIAPGPVKSASSLIGTTLFSILSCKVMLRLRDIGNASNSLNRDKTSLDPGITLSSLRFDQGGTDVDMSILQECSV